MNKQSPFNQLQEHSIRLMHNDLRFLYTIIRWEGDGKPHYINASMPYIGLIVDGIEDWINSYNNSSSMKLQLPTFTMQEQLFYEKMRGCHKLWDRSYNDIYNRFKEIYEEHKKYFSCICHPLAKCLHLYDIYGTYKIDEKYYGNSLLDYYYVPEYATCNTQHSKATTLVKHSH